MWRPCVAFALSAVSIACSGARGASKTPSAASEGLAPEVEQSCASLCADEAKCGAVSDGCLGACTRDASFLKKDVPQRIVSCRKATLARACYGKESAFTHGDLLADARCLSEASAPYAADASNRRAWATASCDRMIRCQATSGADVRAICIQSTMSPPEADAKEALIVIDALRPDVVTRFAACMQAGACPPPGKSDDVESACMLSAVSRKRS